jgi:hypothetical protein
MSLERERAHPLTLPAMGRTGYGSYCDNAGGIEGRAINIDLIALLALAWAPPTPEPTRSCGMAGERYNIS